jgi:hypothetical protein
MTPDAAAAASALAAWAAAAVSILFGAVGVVLALRSNSIANKATKAANDALKLSRESNTIAVDANDISTRANGLAQEANDISRDSRDRAAERNDVDWVGFWREPGVYLVRNDGQDGARAVRAAITVDEEVVVGEAAQLAAGDELVLLFPRALAAYDNERRQRERAESDDRAGPRFAMPGTSLGAMFGIDHFIGKRITWQTDLGTHHVFEETFGMNSLAP